MTRLLNALAAATLMMASDEVRPTAEPIKPRNYDVEGPRVRHDPAPAEPLTRQQRRKLERQAAKRR